MSRKKRSGIKNCDSDRDLIESRLSVIINLIPILYLIPKTNNSFNLFKHLQYFRTQIISKPEQNFSKIT